MVHFYFSFLFFCVSWAVFSLLTKLTRSLLVTNKAVLWAKQKTTAKNPEEKKEILFQTQNVPDVPCKDFFHRISVEIG